MSIMREPVIGMVILALVIILWMKGKTPSNVMHQSRPRKEKTGVVQLIFRVLAGLAALILCDPQIMVETCQKHGVVVVLAVSILCVILVFAVLVVLFFIGIFTGRISPA